MKKLMTTILIGMLMSISAVQANENEPVVGNSSVELIPMSSEQAEKLLAERVMYQAVVNRVMAMEDQSMRQQRLEAIYDEYQRRIDEIVNVPRIHEHKLEAVPATFIY